ncbi:SOS response-associated peptidase family protein [Pseudomonas sp. FP198]|uniref:SOS response-associated peptidase family protein n=1 Tax=Pseudomonas sp. FP198 TaxID=2954084 RepID=UPI00352255D1
MFFGALAQARPGLDEQDGDGFVIITASCDQGMVDIHDRRPLVLSPEQARERLGPDLSPRQAGKLRETVHGRKPIRMVCRGQRGG